MNTLSRWFTAVFLAAALLLSLAHLLQGAWAARLTKNLAQAETDVAAGSGPTSETAFPLAVSPNGRYLQDAKGRPFLIHADTAWSLIVGLTREDAKAYFADRRARGFNSILVNLLEHVSPRNAYGEAPFLTAGSFSTPNEAYFAHADWVIREATAQGFLILLAPAYLGANGGDEGWYQKMVASGHEQMRFYGDYVGRRYSMFKNILWINGGDFSPPDKDLVRTIAEAIRAHNPNAIHSAHNGSESAALDYWKGEPWIGINTVYTYKPVYLSAEKQYLRTDYLPFFLIESAYEFEHGATAHRIRTQAYQALLSGAAGHVFGNNPIWHFEKSGLYPAPVGWREALDSAGSRSMTHLRNLFEQLPWWELRPDLDGHFLTHGEKVGERRAVAAVTADRRLGIVYVPDGRSISLDLRALVGKPVVARWYDPRQGRFLEIADAIDSAEAGHIFATPATATNKNDWILIIQAQN